MADRLKQAGLDYYNHNIDTSESYYGKVTTTHTFADRMETLDHVRASGMKVCCGGIIGMGEGAADRVAMLVTLANLRAAPRKRAHQQPDAHRRHAAFGCRAGRLGRIRPHHRAAPGILMPRSFVRLSGDAPR